MWILNAMLLGGGYPYIVLFGAGRNCLLIISDSFSAGHCLLYALRQKIYINTQGSYMHVEKIGNECLVLNARVSFLGRVVRHIMQWRH